MLYVQGRKSPINSSLKLPSRFSRDRSGAIAPMFAAAISLLVLVMATALEVGRWAIAQNEMQAALDAAVLAGAAKLQSNMADKAAAIELANNAYKANIANRRFAGDVTEDIQFSVEGFSIVARGTAELNTVMAKVVGVQSLPLLGLNGTNGGMTSDTGAVATITNSNFEISVMLDITGSMCDDPPDTVNDAPCTSGAKLDAMKTAAVKLVNTMLASQDLKQRVRIAIVPFSDGVRLPLLAQLGAAGLSPGIKTLSESYQECDKKGKNCQTKYNYYYYHPTECVAERMGTNKYADVGPGPGNYVMYAMQRRNSALFNAAPLEMGCSLGAASTVTPLSNDKDVLVNKINGLAAKGGTAGHLGTAWAMYTLLPEWKNVFIGNSDDPAPFPAAGDKSLRKIAILMTDGDYNNQFSQGGYKVGTWAYRSDQINGGSATQAAALCTAMKGSTVRDPALHRIEVYTVGFKVSNAAWSMLKTCASDDMHAFRTDEGSGLVQVFEGIAQRVLALYLSE